MAANLELGRGNGRANKTLQNVRSRKGAGNGNAAIHTAGIGKITGKAFYPNVPESATFIKGSASRAKKIDSLKNDPAFR